jgi:hypothetical protein
LFFLSIFFFLPLFRLLFLFFFGENKLIIENVEVGEKQGGLHNLALKLALFLLKDRQGAIDLDVPVSGIFHEGIS